MWVRLTLHESLSIRRAEIKQNRIKRKEARSETNTSHSLRARAHTYESNSHTRTRKRRCFVSHWMLWTRGEKKTRRKIKKKPNRLRFGVLSIDDESSRHLCLLIEQRARTTHPHTAHTVSAFRNARSGKLFAFVFASFSASMARFAVAKLLPANKAFAFACNWFWRIVFVIAR